MQTLEGLPILEYHKKLSAKGKETNAWAVLHEFFDFFGEQSPQEHLWYMLVMALKNDNDEIEARHRSNMIFFYEYSIALYNAAHFLYSKQQKKKPKRKKK